MGLYAYIVLRITNGIKNCLLLCRFEVLKLVSVKAFLPIAEYLSVVSKQTNDGSSRKKNDVCSLS